MATITLTDTKQTKSESSTITIKSNSSGMKTNKNAEPKKNKNAVLRKSKSAHDRENLDTQTKSKMNEENHDIKTQLSRPELDGDADSAIGSEASSVIDMSIEEDRLPNENDELLNNFDNLILHSDSEQSAAQNSSNFSSATPRISSGHKGKFQHNRIQPVDIAPEKSAFQKECLVSNNQETTDTGMDGEQSLLITPILHRNFTTELPSSASSLSSCSRGGMSDFVILHTDADTEEACAYRIHLFRDIGIRDLTVDLFSNIDAGKPGMQSLATLHEKYRYILTYVTNNLKSDRYCRFLHEILLTFGLQEANGKEDRIVPVLTKKERCRIPAISVIRGLLYFNFPLNSVVSEVYLQSVRKLVQKGRAMFQ